MRLVYTGDTTSNFGEFVPAPYIEKVDIWNSKIDLTVAVFLSSDSYENIISVDNLEGLYVYVLYGPSAWAGVSALDWTAEVIEEALVANKLPDDKVIFDYFTTWGGGDESGDPVSKKNYVKIPIAEMIDSGEIIYDANGSPIRKLTYKFDDPWISNGTDDLFGSSERFVEGSGLGPGDLYAFAFASFLDYDALHGEESTGLTVGATGLAEDDLFAMAFGADVTKMIDTDQAIANDILVNAATGDIAYEVIFKGATLQTNPQVMYMMPSGKQVFDGVPIQDITYNYRAPSTMTHLQIVKTFKRLERDYYRQSGDATLSNALSQLSYILQTYADRPEIVLKLKELQTYFPEKVEGVTGALYQRYSNMLAGVLSALDTDPILQKVLLRNAKIVDKRSLSLTPYTSPEEHPFALAAVEANRLNGLTSQGAIIASSEYGNRDTRPDTAEFAAEMSFGDPHPYLYAGGSADDHGWRIGREMYPVLRLTTPGGETAGWAEGDREVVWREQESWDAAGTAAAGTETYDRYPRNVRNFGYFFCDIEKIIHTDTLLSKVFNVKKVEDLFGGKALTNLAIGVPEVELKRGVFEISEDDPFGSNGYRLFRTMTLTNHTTHRSVGALLGTYRDVDEDDLEFAFAGSGETTVGTEELATGMGDTTKATQAVYSHVGHELEATKNWPAPIMLEHNINENFPELALTVDNAYNQGAILGSEVTTTAEETGRDGPNNLSYIIPRNFDVVDSVGLGNYRLLAYEYQDFYSADYGIGTSTGPSGVDLGWGADAAGADAALTIADIAEDSAAAGVGGGSAGEFYIFKTEIADKSINIIYSMLQSYQNAQEELDRYVELAEEHCSYNNIDGNFNAFFSTGMKEVYGENNPDTPWVRAPVIYNLHRDLLNDMFGGDKEAMMEQARTIVDKINPDSGRLEDLQIFQSEFRGLYDTFYHHGSGTIMDIVYDYYGVSEAEDPITALAWAVAMGGSLKTYTTRGDQFPQIFYNYPEGLAAEKWDWSDIDEDQLFIRLLLLSQAWGIMHFWYPSHGVNGMDGNKQVKYGTGGAGTMDGRTVDPVPFYDSQDNFGMGSAGHRFGVDGITTQERMLTYLKAAAGDGGTIEDFKNLWKSTANGLIGEILGWGTGTSMWENHKSGLRHAEVMTLWDASHRSYVIDVDSDDVEYAYDWDEIKMAGFDKGIAVYDTSTGGGLSGDYKNAKELEVNITTSNKKTWVTVSLGDLTGAGSDPWRKGYYSRGFSLQESGGKTICNPMGYMIKKMFDWAPGNNYKDYCEKINRAFLWTTTDSATGQERNSESDSAISKAFSGDEKIATAGQYTSVLEEWANQIVRNAGGANTVRYKQVQYLGRLIYAVGGKNNGHVVQAAQDAAPGSGIASDISNSGRSAETLLHYYQQLSNPHRAIGWTTLNPMDHVLIFDPDKEYTRGQRTIWFKGQKTINGSIDY